MHYDYKNLYDLVNDSRIQKYYTKLQIEDSEKFMLDNNMEIVDLSIYGYNKEDETLKDNKYKLENLSEKLSNLIMVNLYTMYEEVISEFIKCLFINEKNKLKKIISVYKDYEEYLQFSLNEFFEMDNKESYLELMSSRLSKRLISGGPKKLFKRLQCVTNEIVNQKDLDILQELHVKRNEIVHKGTKYEMPFDELQRYYDVHENLLMNIAYYLDSFGVIIIDETGMLDFENNE